MDVDCGSELQALLKKLKNVNENPLLRCKKCDFICQKSKWRKNERFERMIALSAPKPVRLAPWPNPKFETTLPIKVAKGTLTGPIPERIFQLAQPKRRYDKKNDFSKTLDNKTKQPTRNQPSFKRLLELSQPKPIKRHVHPQCVDNVQGNDIKYFTPGRRHNKMNAKDWMEHQKWLKERAKPRRKFNAPIKKKLLSFKSKEKMEESTNRLATLPENRVFVPKKIKSPWEKRPPGKIEPLNLPFVDRLSKPRKVSSETQLNLDYDPYKIKPSALTAVPTARTLELAIPRFVKAVVLDKEYKEHAFTVSKKALKYKATNRIKELARPKKEW